MLVEPGRQEVRKREKGQGWGRDGGESYVSSLSPEAAAVDQARAGEATRVVPLSFPALPDVSPTYTTEGSNTNRGTNHMKTLLH